jgi:hypothetical protein
MERPLRSELITMVTNSLRIAQVKMPHAAKDMLSSAYDKTGKHPYKYASLQSIVDTARPHLLENGLVMHHALEGDVLTSTISHVQSEQFLACHYKLIYKPEDPRSFSAAITFAMKDAYRMLVGVVADDDTDGYLP